MTPALPFAMAGTHRQHFISNTSSPRHHQHQPTTPIIPSQPQSQQLSCGGFHTAVVTARGKVYTWGREEHGMLGHEVAPGMCLCV